MMAVFASGTFPLELHQTHLEAEDFSLKVLSVSYQAKLLLLKAMQS